VTGIQLPGWPPRVALYVLGFVSLPLLVTAGIALYLGAQPPLVSVTDDELVIRTAGGIRLPVSEITAVALREALPAMRRSNWSNVVRKYRVDGLGEALVYVRGVPPYIVARTRDGFVIVGLDDPAATRQIFGELARRVTARTNP
jgi:hypothetical protein